jgi:hypothetical protein
MASFGRGVMTLEGLSRRLKTPQAVQAFLRNQFPYNFEEAGETLRSASECIHQGKAHCLEAALVAAGILEHHGYPPLVMSMESLDDLDHVVFVFKAKTGWGSVGRSREPGLHGRAPKFRSLRDLAWSYWDPFVDKTGALTGYGLANLDDAGTDWRHSKKNVWKVEQYLIDLPHQDFKWSRASKAKFKRLRAEYLERGPIKSGRHWW